VPRVSWHSTRKLARARPALLLFSMPCFGLHGRRGSVAGSSICGSVAVGYGRSGPPIVMGLSELMLWLESVRRRSSVCLPSLSIEMLEGNRHIDQLSAPPADARGTNGVSGDSRLLSAAFQKPRTKIAPLRLAIAPEANISSGEACHWSIARYGVARRAGQRNRGSIAAQGLRLQSSCG